MPNVTPRLIIAAFVGFVLWSGAIASPASATPPAVGPGQGDACRALSPTFHPKARERARFDAVRFAGGAQLSLPVGEPCARPTRRTDV